MPNRTNKAPRDTERVPVAVVPINPVGDIYELPDLSGVAAFLSIHPFVKDLLLEAQPVIRRIWGSASKATLEIVDEPEVGGQEELFCFVQTDLAPEIALQRLDEFDRAWWVDSVQRAEGKLNFSLKYV